MREIYLITVGKLKDTCFLEKERDYIKRLSFLGLIIKEVKSYKEDKDQEADEVLKKIKEISRDKQPYVILLSERGKIFKGSQQFSFWLTDLVGKINKKVIFVIGGAAGHGKLLDKKADFKISLSPLTFPHKLCRLIFIEQIYRAGTISEGHPYHK